MRLPKERGAGSLILDADDFIGQFEVILGDHKIFGQARVQRFEDEEVAVRKRNPPQVPVAVASAVNHQVVLFNFLAS